MRAYLNVVLTLMEDILLNKVLGLEEEYSFDQNLGRVMGEGWRC